VGAPLTKLLLSSTRPSGVQSPHARPCLFPGVARLHNQATQRRLAACASRPDPRGQQLASRLRCAEISTAAEGGHKRVVMM